MIFVTAGRWLSVSYSRSGEQEREEASPDVTAT